ncbi:hypothetical protein SKAU_G00278460 [Synaphobranchus kaupii]|uniref:Uncharacterized protein n=1 Tax=Synaphobranchus kaupii TaxID=118154 RepID=A0A9Q1EWP0_SYNKA|nr:hypothetical protein SKAU_G00278460 [Synaphobranchus kaupii]
MAAAGGKKGTPTGAAGMAVPSVLRGAMTRVEGTGVTSSMAAEEAPIPGSLGKRGGGQCFRLDEAFLGSGGVEAGIPVVGAVTICESEAQSSSIHRSSS